MLDNKIHLYLFVSVSLLKLKFQLEYIPKYIFINQVSIVGSCLIDHEPIFMVL